MPAGEKTKIFPILLVNFIDSFGLSIVIPFLVFLVTKYGGNALVYGILGPHIRRSSLSARQFSASGLIFTEGKRSCSFAKSEQLPAGEIS